jgi:G3E family GTPase
MFDQVKPLAPALTLRQVEFANVIIVNKIDLMSEEQIGRVEAFIKRVNPTAEIVKTSYSQVPLEKVRSLRREVRFDLRQILDTKKYNPEASAQNPMWLAEPRGSHVPETVEYGISSFVYRSRRPFHPGSCRALTV